MLIYEETVLDERRLLNRLFENIHKNKYKQFYLGSFNSQNTVEVRTKNYASAFR
jgi:hypothetical protein